jgi:predicted MPP superfamily phosphohydrolase
MLRNAFQPAGWLVNREGPLYFAGVDDLWYNEFDPSILTRIPEGAATVLLCHNPDAWDMLPPDGLHRVDLMLSGHTHGGQVCLPGYGPLILPVNNKSRHTGLYHPDPAAPHRALYITRGVGHLLKVRLFCPPEITHITLQRA